MPKPIGPTIPRWQLGEQLARLRDEADLSQADMAKSLGCSVSKIQKIEAGDVGIVRSELLAMLDAYGAMDDPLRAELLELQRLGVARDHGQAAAGMADRRPQVDGGEVEAGLDLKAAVAVRLSDGTHLADVGDDAGEHLA